MALARGRSVELQGFPSPPAFEVGGRRGHAVIHSNTHLVHRGWRVVAIDGRHFERGDPDLATALDRAQSNRRYQVVFGPDNGEEQEATDQERARRQAAAGVAAEADAEAAAAAEAEAEAIVRAREIADDERSKQAELEREAMLAREAARQREEAAEEARRKAREEQERQEALAQARAPEFSDEDGQPELRARRAALERQLAKAIGLPPRKQSDDPQQALLMALTRPEPAPAPRPKRRDDNGPCDKCDGKHATDACPHFPGAREKHADAWDQYGQKGTPCSEGSAGVAELRTGRVIAQPGDGSCLFHSLAYVLGSTSASRLRAEIADYIAENPEALVAGNPIQDWVLWDTGKDVEAYAATMRTGSRWGGAVELAVCAQLRRVQVDVYEQRARGFARISSFRAGRPGPPVSLVYGGRVHYDALELS